MESPILGAAYRSRSPNLLMDRCVNLYPEIVESKQGKTPGALYACPGLDFVANVGVGPIRPGGLHAVEGTLYTVSGSSLYAVNTAYGSTLLGALTTTSGPVTMIDNGNQVAVSDGANIYTYGGGLFTQLALPSTQLPPGSLVYQDTLGFYNQLGTFNIWQSNPNDLTTWQALNFTTADGSSENIVGMVDLHRQMIVLKEYSTSFYLNFGLSGFVMQRQDGVFPNIGCASAASIAICGDVVCWLGQDRQGVGPVYMLGGYEAVPVSTFAIDNAISKYPVIDDAFGFSYIQAKHRFYVLTFPTANQTWVLDLTMSKDLGYPVWHERAAFSGGAFNAYEPSSAANFNSQVIVGSSSSGNLYRLDLETFLDNGSTRKWLRAWRAHAKPSSQSQAYRVLELDMETGVGRNVGATPLIMLRYSDDAHTWSHERFGSVGAIGNYNTRIRFRRLGMERRGMTSDRVFELSGTDPFKVSILGAEFN